MRLCSNRRASLILSLALSHLALYAQPSTEPIGASPILVPVLVTDSFGRFVSGLQEQNFMIFEDDRPQTISTFSPNYDAPISIGILLDLSGGMSEKLALERAGALQFLKLSNPHDEFFVVASNNHPTLTADFTSSVDDIDARIKTLETGHGTALLDAVCFALEKLQHANYRRRALLIISDGDENASHHSESAVRSAIRETGAQVDSILMANTARRGELTIEEREGPAFLNSISNDSGGRVLLVNNPSEMSTMATAAAASLRNQYLLAYRTDNSRADGKWRKVKVKLRDSRSSQLTVHASTGYYAPSQ